ncbi:hypothetical protein KZC51_16545 [Microbacterium sp. SSW1-49]|uniref:Histidinol dehydrogenase n=1 Tax=Microbacterium croceum TaxID=2851645 RepID=A0ABT0FJ71_9MICO|nr:hypothetical protein [Microbacterium croceum]MCK2037739.1 hypothetical protein [Microbacterium croceum]
MLATIGFFALAVFGLGAVSAATDTDIISVPGLGQGPGVTGMLIALLVFALMLGLTLRRRSPSSAASLAISLATALGHLVGVWIAVLIGTGGLITATAVAGDLVRGGPSVVLIIAAAIAAWSGIALRRTRSARPRWPWERDEEE